MKLYQGTHKRVLIHLYQCIFFPQVYFQTQIFFKGDRGEGLETGWEAEHWGRTAEKQAGLSTKCQTEMTIRKSQTFT